MGWLSNVGNWIADTAEAAYDTAAYAVQNPIRATAVLGQGIVQGVASGAGGLVDLAAMGSNYVAGTEFSTNTAETWQEGVTIDALRANSPEERRLQSLGRGVGEVGSFVAVGVLTAGAGGVALGAASGTARATAMAAARTTAAWAAPTTRVGAAIDATAVGVLATMDYNEETELLETRTNVYESGLSPEEERAETVREIERQMGEEFDANQAELDSGDIDASRREELETRQGEIREAAQIILDMKSGDLSPEEEDQHFERLQEIIPISAADDPADLLLSRDGTRQAVEGFETAVAATATEPPVAIQWSDPELASMFGGTGPDATRTTTPTMSELA